MLRDPLPGGGELGQLEPWHAEQFAAAVEHARPSLAPWIPFAHTVRDVESAREHLRRLAVRHAEDTCHNYGVWLDGRLVGGVVFPTFDVRDRTCELGVWLVPEAAGRGLATAACRYVLDWAFGERGMVRAEWHTDPRNERSRAAARRLGMTHEGTLRSAYVLGGARQDSEVWSVLADEWAAHR